MNWKKVKHILGSIIGAAAFTAALFAMIAMLTVRDQDTYLFGYRGMIVLSDSMKKTDFEAGDLIFAKKVDPDSLKAGDIISFYSKDSMAPSKIVSHKIRETLRDDNGLSFVTYGTTTDTNDAEAVSAENIIGRYTGRIPKAGLFFNFLKSIWGYIFFITVPFMLLMYLQMKNCLEIYEQLKEEESQTAATETA